MIIIRITIKRISAKIILSMKIHETLVRLEICEFSAFSDLTHTLQNLYVMALRQKIEWDPEEVAVGYDLSSIYEGLGENSTVPVISSVANITDPAVNITAVVREAAKQVAEMVVKTTNTTLNPATIVSTTVAPPSGFTPSTVSSIVKRVVEHLGREPSSPVATVCICIFFFETFN